MRPRHESSCEEKDSVLVLVYKMEKREKYPRVGKMMKRVHSPAFSPS